MSGRVSPSAATRGARCAGTARILGPRLRRALVLPMAVGLLLAGPLSLLSGGAARAEVAPPPQLRVTWEFDCHASDRGTNRVVLTGSTIEDGTIVFATERYGKPLTKYMPLSAWPIFYFSRDESPDYRRQRVVDWGALAFDTLAVGETAAAWVRQLDTRWGRSRWKWTAEIVDKTVVETEAFGALEVYVIETRVSTPGWSLGTTIVNHYAPEMNMITYIKEHDSEDRIEECRLVARK